MSRAGNGSRAGERVVSRNKSSASIAVIGGGVIGASVAYHLALNGMRDVVIIDAAPGPGHGSTGKATGGFRAQFSTPVNVNLSLYSRGRLLEFLNETGVDPGYEPVGYLWIAHNDRHLDALAAAQTVQREHGLTEAVMLGPDEITALNPAIAPEGIIGGTFCQTDGYIRPLEILRGYLEAGRRLGVTERWGSSCLGLERDGGRIRSIRTSTGIIDVDNVVNAAGPWASRVAALGGFSLPVTPLRRQAAISVPTDAIPANMPMTIFLDTGFHVRARDGRALLCWPTNEAAGDTLKVDEAWLTSVDEMKTERIPALANVPLDREQCYAGLYEMSPDHHAIVGFASECENLFLVNGSSGHGVMHSPALGSVAADMICGNEPAIDVSSLRPSRFADGAAINSGELL